MNSGRCLSAIYSKHRIYCVPSNWLIKPRKAALFSAWLIVPSGCSVLISRHGQQQSSRVFSTHGRLSLHWANGVSFIKRAILIYKPGLDLTKISKCNLPDKWRSKSRKEITVSLSRPKGYQDKFTKLKRNSLIGVSIPNLMLLPFYSIIKCRHFSFD